ncbi:MAG: hypothetical protein KDA52_08205 [Planctomycetaceae bacterium]|nr:hypothetical protein [Planctomycetaceae bacterium]
MQPITLTAKVHFTRGRRSHKELHPGSPQDAPVPPRLPRVAKLMALAMKFEGLVRDGVVADYAELARLGHVTRARMSQIMSLLHLAPDIQESILFLPRVESGKDPITERNIRPIAAIPDWRKQRRMWIDLHTE